jgi:hypothetical protein
MIFVIDRHDDAPVTWVQLSLHASPPSTPAAGLCRSVGASDRYPAGFSGLGRGPLGTPQADHFGRKGPSTEGLRLGRPT